MIILLILEMIHLINHNIAVPSTNINIWKFNDEQMERILISNYPLTISTILSLTEPLPFTRPAG